MLLLLTISKSKFNNSSLIISVGREELEVAISTLALRQQAEIQRLLEMQEKQREQMKKMFEEQQKNLIREILQQVNVATQQRRYSHNIPRHFWALSKGGLIYNFFDCEEHFRFSEQISTFVVRCNSDVCSYSIDALLSHLSQTNDSLM